MDFYVIFQCANAGQSPCQDVRVGTQHVQIVCNELGIGEIPLAKFTTRGLDERRPSRKVSVYVPHKIAGNLQSFVSTDMVEVIVPPGGLTGFGVIQAVVCYSSSHLPLSVETIDRIVFSFELDTTAILHEWIQAGQPSVWEINKPFDPMRVIIVKRPLS